MHPDQDCIEVSQQFVQELQENGLHELLEATPSRRLMRVSSRFAAQQLARSMVIIQANNNRLPLASFAFRL